MKQFFRFGLLTVLALALLPLLNFNNLHAQGQEDNALSREERRQDQENRHRSPPITEIYQDLYNKIERQAEIDALLLAELQSGLYTFEEPFIFVDPYGESPLTAIMLFNTEEAMNIAVHIQGDYANDSVDFQFDGYNTAHTIPVYGLYPDRVNTVTLTATNENGDSQHIEFEVETDVIPEDHNTAEIEIINFSEEDYSPGLNLLYEKWAGNAIDSHGVFRWTFPIENTISLQYSKNENGFFYPLGGYHSGDALIVEINPLGRILNIYHNPSGVHHDIELSEHNSIIVPTANPRTAESVEDAVAEIDLATGEIINFLDYKDILNVNRAYGGSSAQSNWLHVNSVTADGEFVIFSSKNQSAVVKHDWEGNIVWILGDPGGYTEPQSQFLLSPIGENFEYPYDQHAAYVLPDYDNNPDTLDLMLFDNGSRRISVNAEIQEQIRNGEIEIPYLYSRLVHYRINEAEMTVEQIWQYGKNNPEHFSTARGDADMLANSNVLGTFALTTVADMRDPQIVGEGDGITRYFGRDFSEDLVGTILILEVDQEGNEVWQAKIFTNNETTTGYRTERMNIYTPNANNLRLGNEVGIFVPEHILGLL